MKSTAFRFLKLMQVHAAPSQRPAIGFRELTLHASAVAEAAERFLHERLNQKRKGQFVDRAS